MMTETYRKLRAAAATGNAAALRKLTDVPADMASEALKLLLSTLFYETEVQESPSLLRDYAECVKTLFDWGADVRSFPMRGFRERKAAWQSAQAYRTLCLTAGQDMATPHDAELVALVAHIEFYYCDAFKGGPCHKMVTEALGRPTEWRLTMRRAAPIFSGLADP